MGKKKRIQAAEPKVLGQARLMMMILQTWTTGMEVNSKEEGADTLYDEPTRNLTS